MAPILRWCALWLFILTTTLPAQGAALQPHAPVQGKFVAQPYTATMGKAAKWTLWIAPVGQEALPNVEIIPVDPYRWRFLQPVEFDLDDERLVEIHAVPLAVGEAAPAVEVHVGASATPLILTAPEPVNVLAVESQVEIILLPESAESYLLQVRNRSPFAIHNLQFVPTGSGVTLAEELDMPGLAPFSSSQSMPIKAELSGIADSPRLAVHYRWVDDLGTEWLGTSAVDWQIAAQPDGGFGYWLSTPRSELYGTLLGFVLGTVTGVLLDAVRRLMDITIQRRRDNQRTWALMEVAAHKAIYASEQGLMLDLSPIEAILNDAGLFARVLDMGAYDAVHSLWQCGNRHNAGIKLPGGNRRAEKLKVAAEELRRFLPKKSVVIKENNTNGIGG